MHKHIKLLLLFSSLAVNIVLMYKLFFISSNAPTGIQTYPYLSKRIFAENQNDILINFVPLRSRLKTYVASITEPLGIYFEYLPSGVSIGINEKIETNIASLLKVPLVMAVYKQYELGSLSKNQKLTILAKHIDKRFGNLWTRGEGAQVAIDEAVKLTLTESDNTAANMLLDALPKNALDDVADYLDIPKEKQENFIVISPKNYSSILRSLYLSSYLQESSSSEIIDILTKTTFNDKLPAGVESRVKVAHKVGVYTNPKVTVPTFSDCGIVYVPQRPYILCIMTNTSEENARRHMTDISKMIYDYVSSVNKDN